PFRLSGRYDLRHERRRKSRPIRNQNMVSASTPRTTKMFAAGLKPIPYKTTAATMREAVIRCFIKRVLLAGEQAVTGFTGYLINLSTLGMLREASTQIENAAQCGDALEQFNQVRRDRRTEAVPLDGG